MTPSPDAPALPWWATSALALLAGTALLQAGRLRRALTEARGLVAGTAPFEQQLPQARRRILLLGDSTGVGVGGGPQQSVAALLAQEHPQLRLVNACRSGARLADVVAQVAAHAPALHRFDGVLLLAGGNDVLRTRNLKQLTAASQGLMQALAPVAARVVWLGPANIGHAPVFLPPLSWWLSQRTRQASRLYARCARQVGASYLDFFGVGAADPFVADRRRWFARDGIHPSAEAYRYCYARLRRSAAWQRMLGLKAPATAAA